MDCMDLKYENEFFDLVIDKSLLDCITCYSEAEIKVDKMLKECQRVIRTGGCYVIVSYADRMVHLKDRVFLDFEVQHI